MRTTKKRVRIRRAISPPIPTPTPISRPSCVLREELFFPDVDVILESEDGESFPLSSSEEEEEEGEGEGESSPLSVEMMQFSRRT